MARITNNRPLIVLHNGDTISLQELALEIQRVLGSGSLLFVSKGDLAAGSGLAGLAKAFGVGVDGTVLTSNSAELLGLQWTVPAMVSTGDVVGPMTAVDSHIVIFNGTSGKIIKTSGKSIADIFADHVGLVDPHTQYALITQLANYLVIGNNLSDLDNAASARSNLVLGNIDNTSDANKPVSIAQQTALDLKATVVALALKAPLASPIFTGLVRTGGDFRADTGRLYLEGTLGGTGIIQGALDGNWGFLYIPEINGTTAAHGFLDKDSAVLFKIESNGNVTAIGTVSGTNLTNLDNTSDANKPVSTAQQTALNLKASLAANNTFTKAQRGGVTTLTSAASLLIALNNNNNYEVVLAINATLQNSSDTPVKGQSGIIKVKQDGGGGNTLAYASQYKFAGGTAPVLSTAGNAVDLLAYYVHSATEVFISITKDVK